MFDNNFTFDQKVVADTRRRDADEPESAMSPKEVHAELPPPPPSVEAATQQSAAAANNRPPGKEATTTPTESDTIDILARQLGRQTLLQEDPQYQWRRSQQPPTFLESSAAISPGPPAATGAPSAARQSTTKLLTAFADTLVDGHKSTI
ncbi:hypothetical protein PG994_010941 [Apiospora phragmitis]|uniref:Uncharacterized protein n=1 Tax=Apiospora phragmitis TaxID=2905665 RepID=A0ABR1TRF7_9PEZI